MPPVVREAGGGAVGLPELKQVNLSSRLIASLANASAGRCREVLLAAGLLTEVQATDDPDDPRAWMLAVQSLLLDLTALENLRDRLMSRDDRLVIRDAPLWAWLTPLGLPLLGWGMAGQMSSTAGQVLSVVLTIVLPCLVWSVSVVVLYFAAIKRRRERRERYAQTRVDIKETRRSLLEGASRTLARDFVARAGSRLVVCTPSFAMASPERVEVWLLELETWKRAPLQGWRDLDFSSAPPTG